MLVLLTFSAMLPVSAQQARQPWTFTLEERIALRTNPELARERVRGAVRGQPTSNADAQSSADRFDGKSHPELFLPHEVFRSLMTLAFLGPARNGERFRKGLTPEVVRLGLQQDFWERLRSVSAVYLSDSWSEADLGASLREQSGKARRDAERTLSLKQLDVCRSRADAIAAARKEFGSERFDRFLYEVIAVNKFHSEHRLPAPEVLRWAEAGCR
jgi:hypothetical protein